MFFLLRFVVLWLYVSSAPINNKHQQIIFESIGENNFFPLYSSTWITKRNNSWIIKATIILHIVFFFFYFSHFMLLYEITLSRSINLKSTDSFILLCMPIIYVCVWLCGFLYFPILSLFAECIVMVECQKWIYWNEWGKSNITKEQNRQAHFKNKTRKGKKCEAKRNQWGRGRWSDNERQREREREAERKKKRRKKTKVSKI